jgi:hypothetical protein
MVVMIRHDLEFILNQIIISEQHAAGADLASLLPSLGRANGGRHLQQSPAGSGAVWCG